MRGTVELLREGSNLFYSGNFDVEDGQSKRKDEEPPAYARIPFTQLYTKNYVNRRALREALAKGDAIAK